MVTTWDTNNFYTVSLCTLLNYLKTKLLRWAVILSIIPLLSSNTRSVKAVFRYSAEIEKTHAKLLRTAWTCCPLHNPVFALKKVKTETLLRNGVNTLYIYWRPVVLCPHCFRKRTFPKRKEKYFMSLFQRFYRCWIHHTCPSEKRPCS